MATILITSFAVVAVVLLALYLWQKPALHNQENALPQQPNARGLFAEDSLQEAVGDDDSEAAEKLIARAKQNDLAVLDEARTRGDMNVYDRVLSELVRSADSKTGLHGLMSYVASHDLPVNKTLARATTKSWTNDPNRGNTAKALHFAALTDDADVYREAVEVALKLWREEKIKGTSPAELRALFDGEFWVLSSRTRSSGAGFVLKRTLEKARRELEAAVSEARA